MVTEIYNSGINPIILTGIFITYGCINAKNVIEKEYNIYTDKNIRNEGYKVNFISDLHFGTTMSNNELQKYCDNISQRNVDIVILGGDIVDENTTLKQMKLTIEEIENKNLRDDVIIFVGGAPVTRAYAMEIKADYYTKDVVELRDLLDENLDKILKQKSTKKSR